MCCDLAQAEVAKSSGCEFTTYPAKAVNSVPNRSELPPDFAVRGTSVCGRVTSVPLRKANWLADRLHSIGRFEGRRQSIPGKWTRWGLSEGQEGEPIRTEAMGGLPPAANREGVPKALIRRVLTIEKGNEMTGCESFKLGTCNVPDGEKGLWKIDTFQITPEEARFETMRSAFSGNAIMAVSAGTYRRLTCKGRGVVMSNTKMEVRTNYEAFHRATGRVLINGLGLGMLLEAILSKPDVTYVRVIEKEQDVIALVGPHFDYDKRVEIIHSDAYEYSPANGERFNYCWHDIWDSLCSDNLPMMAKLGRRYGKRRSDGQGFWGRDLIRANARRWG